MYPALLTDLYELTMLAGYQREGMLDRPAAFELFFRDMPFDGGYAVFAGLQPALDYLSQLSFHSKELDYIASLGLFSKEFLDFLRNFKFCGNVTAPREGQVVFPGEPLLTVEGRLGEVQFVETVLLNIINFQTLVATKAARLSVAAGDGEVIEFGLRRAQGPDGGLSVARAAAIGGVRSTSNVLGGYHFDLPVKGTHAHSWVMAFPDELSAFRAYAECFPDHSVLLVDTYDTMSSGLPNSLRVARELRAAGHELLGIRLDSGDLAYLSQQARRLFDAAGFPGVKIVASNELDEYVIHSIRSEGGQIDIYGVGTRLATCAGPGGGALGGVYKLVEYDGQPRMKITSDPVKSTLPGRKRVFRILDEAGHFVMDVIDLDSSAAEAFCPGQRVYDPANPQRNKKVPEQFQAIECRSLVMEDGQVLEPAPTLKDMGDFCQSQLQALPQGCLRLINPHLYKVGISERLLELRTRLQQEHTF